MALHLARAPVLTAVVLFGAAAAFFYLAGKSTTKNTKGTKGKKGNQKSPLSDPFTLHPSSFILYGLALIVFASSVAWPFQIDPNDDLICYLMLPEKILQTGTLIDPFSFRRAGSLGGHWFLEALVMIVGGDRSGHVVDSGIARVILFGIVMAFPLGSGKWGNLHRWVLALIALIYPVPRINTMSALTGSCSLLALAVTIFKIRSLQDFLPNLKSWIPALLLTACAALMRPYFALAAAGLIFTGWMIFVILQKQARGFQLGIALGVLTAVVVLPWSLVLYFSSGTPLVPPFPGNINPLFMETSVAFAKFPSVLWGYVIRPEVMPLIATILLGIFLRGPLFSSAFALIVIFVAVVFSQKMSATTSQEMPRYLVPILLPAALFMAGAMAGSIYRRFAPISILCLSMIVGNADAIVSDFRERTFGLPVQLLTRATLHPDDPNHPGTYVDGVRRLQYLVPKGEKILVAVDFPYVLDFTRNDIFSIDCIGAAGPDGGFPFFQGKNQLNSYLHKQGIYYLLCMDFDKAIMLYNRPFWKNNPSPQWYYNAIYAPRFLDFMNNIDNLSDWGRVSGSFANIRLIELPEITCEH